MFDKLRSLLLTDEADQQAATPQTLQRALAFLLVETGYADGDFDADERARARGLLAGRFGLDDAAAEALIDEGVAMHQEAVDWYGSSRALKDAFDYDERIEVIEMLWEVAYADGVLDHLEANLMRRVAGLLYVDDVDSGAARKRVLAKLGRE
ncbi:hypothetical protein CKO38_10325 [Rhodospirillum rubrum]|uniref:tellurite resistance TerB family protein n=1 Tax=Rhodospirillum rubrum TaxID=1085 RepID=UPI00190445F7|nr:TerB family tellurite resistance protein [Rhodospirillum rubrum]MBK1665200.1 hypothetical protein [Rhodospirillum rubrum]MBK1677056.1 hypothetical protein [Rhodospirillum rubrum]